MFLKKIDTKGLAHYSYLIGSGSEFAVIDPRRDVEIYIKEARKANKKITHIFETHRNEDYISGAVELAEKTGAKIYISKYEDLGYAYGNQIGEEDSFKVGKLLIKPIHTPGHTLGHLSYAVYVKDRPYMVFVGDALFFGDLGRTDFYGEENLEKMTGLLYDSIFNKIMPLGDSVIMMPAHGAGSACGGNIEDREFSTLGYERMASPVLQVRTREEFIEKHGYMRLKNPYFEKVEICNVKGAQRVDNSVILNPYPISDEGDYPEEVIIDIRSKSAFAGSHLPNSIHIEKEVFSYYVGWIIDSESPFYIMSDGLTEEDVNSVYWTARRMGFDKIIGSIGDETIHSLEKSGAELLKLEEVQAPRYFETYKLENVLVLDVRREEELSEDDPVCNRLNIPLQVLASRIGEVPEDKEIFVLCKSGERSVTAASILERIGIEAKVITGGMLSLKEYIKNNLE